MAKKTKEIARQPEPTESDSKGGERNPQEKLEEQGQGKEGKPQTSNKKPEQKQTRREERNRNEPDFHCQNIVEKTTSQQEGERRNWRNATRGRRTPTEVVETEQTEKLKY